MVLFGNLLGNYSGRGDVDGGVVYEMAKQNIYKIYKLEARADSERQYLFEISATHGRIKG